MNFLIKIRKSFLREVDIISNDRNLISVLLLGPIFYAFFYTSIYSYKSEIKIPIAILDYDKSQMTAEIIQMINQHQKLYIAEVLNDFNSARDHLNSLVVNAVVIFPKHFEEKIKKEKISTIQIFLNNSRFLVSNDINKSINEIIIEKLQEIRTKYFYKKGFIDSQAEKLSEPINIDSRSLFNITETYGDFLIPAILMLIIHQTLMIGIAESTAKENENKTLLSINNEFDNDFSSFVIGKIAFYFILYFSYSLFFFLLILNLNSIPFSGSVTAFLLISSFGILSVSFLSIFVASFFQKKLTALQIITLLSYPIFLVSGFSWPIESMPSFLQYISQIVPFTNYSAALSKIIRANCSFSDVTNEFFNLLILTFLFALLAFLRFKYLFKHHSNIYKKLSITKNGVNHEKLI